MATSLGYQVAAYFTEMGAPILHPIEGATVVHELESPDWDAAAVAIGDTGARQRFHDALAGRVELPALVHPSAIVSPTAQIGAGALLMQNVVVNADAVIGRGSIVNVACCVAHDCQVGPHSHLAPATQMGGGSSVGTGVFCGTSTVILPNTNVGDWSITGAGSVVTRDVSERSLALGVPARVVKAL